MTDRDRASTTSTALGAELSGSYYAACNAVFRGCTTQGELMLEETIVLFGSRRPRSILSVGSGAGLFEIPMLEAMREDGIGPSKFVGVDVSQDACAVLEHELRTSLGDLVDFDVVCDSFQKLETTELFDLVLYNHTLEYLQGDPKIWLEKSHRLLAADGNILIFSPERGGINRIYAEQMQQRHGWMPHFSDDIERALRGSGARFVKRRLIGRCDISLLQRSDEDKEMLMLLSFLAQTDCRGVPPRLRAEYVDYYLSLRDGEGNSIPHPTSMFVV